MADVRINDLTLDELLTTDVSFELQRSTGAGGATRRSTLEKILEASQKWKGLYDVREAGVLGNGTDESGLLNQAYVEAQADSRYLYIPNNMNVSIASTVRCRTPTLGEGGISNAYNKGPRITNIGINNIYTPMIQLDTTLDLNLHAYFAWKGVQLHGNSANASLKCSGFNTIGGRATPGDWDSSIRCLTNYLFDDYTVQDCYGFGFRIVGFIGMIRRARMYNNGINRLILGNACLVEGGEYVPARDVVGAMTGVNSWGLQLIASDGKAIRDSESVHKIHLNSVCIESNGVCNGLQVGENLVNIKTTNLYLEGFESDSVQTCYSLDVGSVGRSEDPNSSTYALLPATGLAANAVVGITFDSGAVGGASGYQAKGGRARFNNIRGLTFLGKNSMSSKQCEFTDKCFDIIGMPAGTGVQSESYYYKDAWITDATGTMGSNNRSVILNPNGKGGLRGWESVVDYSSGRVTATEELNFTRAGSSSLKITHSGAALPLYYGNPVTGNEFLKCNPHGLSGRILRNKMLGLACWVYIPAGGDYVGGKFSPGVHVYYQYDTSNGAGTWVNSMPYPRTFQYTYQNSGDPAYYDAQFFTPDRWHLLYMWVKLPDLPIRDVGVVLFPLTKNTNITNPVGPNSFYVSDLRLAVNPASMERLAEGIWDFDPEAGTVLSGGAIETWGLTVPSSDTVYSMPGDIHRNSAPTAGGIAEWECVTKGKPGVWAVSKRLADIASVLEYDFSKSSMAEAAIKGPALSVTRASDAWMRQADGKLVKVLANVPRVGHFPGTQQSTRVSGIGSKWAATPTSGGLLLEGARTNMVPDSRIPSGWTGSGATVEYSTIAGPDLGLAEAVKITETTATSSHLAYSNCGLANGSYVDGGAYTFSIFMKAGTSSVGRLSTKNKSNDSYSTITVDLTNGNIVASAFVGTTVSAVGVESYINGWYRLWIACNNVGTGVTTTPDFQMYSCLNDGAGTTSFTGNGSYLYVWGPQIEAGEDVTSYIRTTGTAVTRAADVLATASLATNQQLVPDASTIYMDYFVQNKADSTICTPLRFSNSVTPSHFFQVTANYGQVELLINGPGGYGNWEFGAVEYGPRQRQVALAWKSGGSYFHGVDRGGTVLTTTSLGGVTGALPAMDRVRVGSSYVIVQNLKVVPTHHSDEQLQAGTL